MIIDISVAVIAVAFALLVIYLIVLIRTLSQTLAQVSLTVVEARKIVSEAQVSAIDLNRKLEALDPVFKSVENLGEVLEYETAEFKDRKYYEAANTCKEGLSVSDVAKVFSIGARLWSKYRKGDHHG